MKRVKITRAIQIVVYSLLFPGILLSMACSTVICMEKSVSLFDPELNIPAVKNFLKNRNGFLKQTQLTIEILDSLTNFQKSDFPEIPFVLINSLTPRTKTFNTNYTLRAVGLIDAKTTKKKLLIANEDNKGDISTLAAHSSNSLITSMISDFNKKLASKISSDTQIMTVPKDMDALMAVSFGLYDSCIVTDGSLYDFAAVSPEAYAKLKVIAQSNPVENLQLYVNKNYTEGQAVLEAFIQSFSLPEGKMFLRLLGLEGWRLMNE